MWKKVIVSIKGRRGISERVMVCILIETQETNRDNGEFSNYSVIDQ